jgi:hypothetical protein
MDSLLLSSSIYFVLYLYFLVIYQPVIYYNFHFNFILLLLFAHALLLPSICFTHLFHFLLFYNV